MRFNPEASWGANAGLDIPRKALEAVKVDLRPVIDTFCSLFCSYYLTFMINNRRSIQRSPMPICTLLRELLRSKKLGELNEFQFSDISR